LIIIFNGDLTAGVERNVACDLPAHY